MNSEEPRPDLFAPDYDRGAFGYQVFRSKEPFRLGLKGESLPELQIAYETWGHLNKERSNTVLVFGGLTSNSHVRSSKENNSPGWWEHFVGPGCVIDTDRFFVVGHNFVGGCFGTTGPRSINKETGKPYGTTFPIFTIEDQMRALFLLVDHLGIEKVHATIGPSLGGMMALQCALSYPDRIGRVVSIAACARSHPATQATRYLATQAVTSDPNWCQGHYYGKPRPKAGLALARAIGVTSFRSEVEWEQRFARERVPSSKQGALSFQGPDFQLESYLRHHGDKYAAVTDPNTLLYQFKAMDLFDIGKDHESLSASLAPVKSTPFLVVSFDTDTLFPVWQQREMVHALREAGNEHVTFVTFETPFGHDAVLLDRGNMGTVIKGYLETDLRHTGEFKRLERREDNGHGHQNGQNGHLTNGTV